MVSPLYREALDLVRRTRKASTSLFMREMHVSYDTADGLIRALEREGVISKADELGRRQILVKE